MDALSFYLDRQIKTITDFKISLSKKTEYWIAPLLPICVLFLSVKFILDGWYIFVILLMLSLLYSYLMIRASFYFLRGINIFISRNAVHVILKEVKSFVFQDGFILKFDKGYDINLFTPGEEKKVKDSDNNIGIQQILFYEDFIDIKINSVKNCKIIDDSITTYDLMKVMSNYYSNNDSNSFTFLEKHIEITKPKNNKCSNFKSSEVNIFDYNQEKLKSNLDESMEFSQTLKLKNKKLKIIKTALQDIKNNGLVDDNLSVEDFMMVLSYCFGKITVKDPILKFEVNSKEVSSFLEYFFIPFLNLIEDKSDIGLISVCEYFQYKKGGDYKPVRYKSIARKDRRNTSNSKIEGYNLLLNKYKMAILKI
ncbi:MAG: hypothetical protein RLZZ540_2018 [Bacteroidota bacterium]|jgi:hypothetical protein